MHSRTAQKIPKPHKRPEGEKPFHLEGLPKLEGASSAVLSTMEVVEMNCDIIRIEPGAIRGEAIYTAKFDWTAMAGAPSPVVLLDSVSVSEDSVVLLTVDNEVEFSPVVAMKFVLRGGKWTVEGRQEIVAMYPNYLGPVSSRTSYDLRRRGDDGPLEVLVSRKGATDFVIEVDLNGGD